MKKVSRNNMPRRLARKNQDGVINIRVPIHLHNFIVNIGQKEGLFNYEVIQKMAEEYAKNFCPSLTRLLVK